MRQQPDTPTRHSNFGGQPARRFDERLAAAENDLHPVFRHLVPFLAGNQPSPYSRWLALHPCRYGFPEAHHVLEFEPADVDSHRQGGNFFFIDFVTSAKAREIMIDFNNGDYRDKYILAMIPGHTFDTREANRAAPIITAPTTPSRFGRRNASYDIPDPPGCSAWHLSNVSSYDEALTTIPSAYKPRVLSIKRVANSEYEIQFRNHAEAKDALLSADTRFKATGEALPGGPLKIDWLELHRPQHQPFAPEDPTSVSLSGGQESFDVPPGSSEQIEATSTKPSRAVLQSFRGIRAAQDSNNDQASLASVEADLAKAHDSLLSISPTEHDDKQLVLHSEAETAPVVQHPMTPVLTDRMQDARSPLPSERHTVQSVTESSHLRDLEGLVFEPRSMASFAGPLHQAQSPRRGFRAFEDKGSSTSTSPARSYDREWSRPSYFKDLEGLHFELHPAGFANSSKQAREAGSPQLKESSPDRAASSIAEQLKRLSLSPSPSLFRAGENRNSTTAAQAEQALEDKTSREMHACSEDTAHMGSIDTVAASPPPSVMLPQSMALRSDLSESHDQQSLLHAQLNSMASSQTTSAPRVQQEQVPFATAELQPAEERSVATTTALAPSSAKQRSRGTFATTAPPASMRYGHTVLGGSSRWATAPIEENDSESYHTTSAPHNQLIEPRQRHIVTPSRTRIGDPDASLFIWTEERAEIAKHQMPAWLVEEKAKRDAEKATKQQNPAREA